MRRQLRTAVPLALTLAALALLCATPAFAMTPYMPEWCVTPSLPSTQQAPSLAYWGEVRYTDIAVFEDDRSGNWDVYVHDLWSDWEQQVAGGPSAQRHPSASGSWVAYEDDRNTNLDIYLVNLTSGVETLLTPSTATQQDPAITGGALATGTRVVWEDQRNGNWDIYLYDVDTATTKRLTSSTAAQLDPAIDGRRVVWADKRNGNWDVYLYDTVKKATTRLTTNGADQTAPAISGTMVVYQDDRNGNWDIYGYDLATKKELRLTRSAADQTAPALSPRWEREPITPGRRVVYADARNGASDIYLTDTVAGGEFRLTDDGADQLAPAISGNRVVWTDLRDTSSGSATADVYRGVLETPWISLVADPKVVRYNGTTTLKGSLGLDSGPIAGGKLVLSSSPRLWTGWVITDVDGGYRLDVPHIKAKTSFRMIYRGDATHLPAVSEAKSVKARAWVSTPSIPKEFSYQKTVTVSCFLKPRHTAGGYPVKFLFYRYNRGDGLVLWDWVFWKSVKGKATNYSTYTKCSAKVTFPKPGGPYPGGEKWRVVAVHEDKVHPESVSAYRAFTVTPYVNFLP